MHEKSYLERSEEINPQISRYIISQEVSSFKIFFDHAPGNLTL